MIGVFLGILKFIGIVILIILILLLCISVAVLFVPVRYKAALDKHDDGFKADGVFYWLFHFIHVRITYSIEEYEIVVRIAGIPIQTLGRMIGKVIHGFQKLLDVIFRKKKRSTHSVDEYQGLEDDDKIELVTLEEKSFDMEEETLVEEEKILPTFEKEKKPSLMKRVKEFLKKVIDAIRDFINKIFGFPGKIKRAYKKFKKICKNVFAKGSYWKKFITHTKTKAAIKLLKGQVMLLLKHLNPKSIKGQITFGFSDPSITGQVLGIAGIFFPLYGKTVSIYPKFEEEIIELDLLIKGRIQVFYLLKLAWKLYRDENVKFVIHKFQSQEG